MEINNFLQIMIVGVALSGLIEVIKTKFGTTSGKTKLLTVGLSVLVGGGYVLLQGTPLFTTVIGVLTTASTVYALFLNK